jgi:hypothetical protein
MIEQSVKLTVGKISKLLILFFKSHLGISGFIFEYLSPVPIITKSFHFDIKADL